MDIFNIVLFIVLFFILYFVIAAAVKKGIEMSEVGRVLIEKRMEDQDKKK